MSLVDTNFENVATINNDGSRNFVYTADVQGGYTTWRRIVAVLLIAFYVAIPWIQIGGAPAVFFDLGHQRIHLFGFTLAFQDFWIAFFALTGVGFGLFYITALLGRIWCGWACPQTVFLDHVFRRIDRALEGDAGDRRRLDNSPWTSKKTRIKAIKHGFYAVICLLLAHVLLSYFVSMPGLFRLVATGPSEHFGQFLFVIAVSGLLYLNFAWFREQLCIIVCPYGRLQSAMTDDHSIVIGYDKLRGEPRGKLHHENKGDCVDCLRCVRVCPTGIDIRNGLQMECIACTACMDACDEVMTKIHRPKGLIRYDSYAGFQRQKRKFLRPRILLYTALLILGATAASYSMTKVKPAMINVTRMIGAPFYINQNVVRNHYNLRIINKKNHPVSFVVELDGSGHPIEWNAQSSNVSLPAWGEQEMPVFVFLPLDKFDSKFQFKVKIKGEGTEVEQSVPFVGPRKKLSHD